MPDKKTIRKTIILPDDLIKKIEKQAENDCRTFSQQVNYYLKKSFERDAQAIADNKTDYNTD